MALRKSHYGNFHDCILHDISAFDACIYFELYKNLMEEYKIVSAVAGAYNSDRAFSSLAAGLSGDRYKIPSSH